MFVAMNGFKVNPGKEADFEKQWRERETYLDGVPGFVQFSLLKSDTVGDYISHTIWKDRQTFVDWTESAGDISFGDERDVELKGLGEQRVFAVGWE